MAKNQAKSLKNYEMKSIYVIICIMQLESVRHIFGKTKHYTSFLNYFSILSTISIANGLNLKQISRMLLRAPSNTIYYVKTLESRGFILRIVRRRRSNLGYGVKGFGYIISNKGLEALETIENLAQDKYDKIIVDRGLVKEK